MLADYTHDCEIAGLKVSMNIAGTLYFAPQ
jgi:hypothetical protein